MRKLVLLAPSKIKGNKVEGIKILKLTIFTAAILGLGFFWSAGDASATEYFVDGNGTNGNNAYDGTAPTFQGGLKGPKKTIKEGLKLLQTSDDLKIRQGLYFESGLNLNSGVSGSLNNRITISNYNNESVFLSGGFLISDVGNTGAWSQYSGQVYKDASGAPYYFNLYWAPKAGNIDELQNIRLGYQRNNDQLNNLDEEGEWVRAYGNGYNHYFRAGAGNSMADYIMIGTFINNDTNKHVFDFTNEHDYITIDGIWFVASVGVIRTTELSDYITLNNSRFFGVMGNTNGILLGGDNNLIDNCEGRLTSSYFISTGNSCPPRADNLTVRNSKFSYNQGNVMHTGGTKGMHIYNNDFSHFASSWWYSNYYIIDDRGTADPSDDVKSYQYKHAEGVIGHTPGDPYTGYACFSDLLIENNYFHDADMAKGNPFGVDEQKWDTEVTEGDGHRGNDTGPAYYSACGGPNQGKRLVYRYNINEVKDSAFRITSEKDTCSYDDIRIYGNVFANIEGARDCEGCSVLGLNAMDIGSIGAVGGTSTFGNLKIYNNIFYDYRRGIELGSRHGNALFPGDSFVKNNIFYIQDGWGANDAAGIFFDDGSEISQVESDYNIYYRSDREEVFAFRSGSIYGRTMEQWQSSFGFDGNSRFAEPKFLSPTDKKFSLAVNSPAIDAGTALGLSRDLAGNLIPVDGDSNGSELPDIGPYEYQGDNNRADVNNDGNVSNTDIRLCVQVIIGNHPPFKTNPLPIWAWDADNSGEINLDDVDEMDAHITQKCQAVAPDNLVTNIKDIQAIIHTIISP